MNLHTATRKELTFQITMNKIVEVQISHAFEQLLKITFHNSWSEFDVLIIYQTGKIMVHKREHKVDFGPR